MGVLGALFDGPVTDLGLLRDRRSGPQGAACEQCSGQKNSFHVSLQRFPHAKLTISLRKPQAIQPVEPADGERREPP
jgi:hypothetical protein